MTDTVPAAVPETPVASEHAAVVLSTIVNAYQAEFERRESRRERTSFAQRVARALTDAGITRSGEPLSDQIAITHLHVHAHDEWFVGAHEGQPAGFHFGDYLAARLVEKGFHLEEPKP